MRTATYFSWMQSFSKNKLWSRNGPAMGFQVSYCRVVALFSCLFHSFPMCIWCQTKRMNAAPKTDGLVSHSSGASHSPGSRLQHLRWTPQPLDALALDAPSKKSDTQWLWDSKVLVILVVMEAVTSTGGQGSLPGARTFIQEADLLSPIHFERIRPFSSTLKYFPVLRYPKGNARH